MFVILTFIAAVAAEYALRALDPSDYSPPGPYVGGAFILVIFGVACFQYLILCSEGGAHVARAVGAVQVLSNDTDPKIRQLCNIVEEMALAASQPTPEVFVLEAKEINAFAAGMSPDKAVITVTTGALEQLNRDELQGVIGHEIGHVYNGDSKISLRLAAMLMGFYFALYIGLRIIQLRSCSKFKRKGWQCDSHDRVDFYRGWIVDLGIWNDFEGDCEPSKRVSGGRLCRAVYA